MVCENKNRSETKNTAGTGCGLEGKKFDAPIEAPEAKAGEDKQKAMSVRNMPLGAKTESSGEEDCGSEDAEFVQLRCVENCLPRYFRYCGKVGDVFKARLGLTN